MHATVAQAHLISRRITKDSVFPSAQSAAHAEIAGGAQTRRYCGAYSAQGDGTHAIATLDFAGARWTKVVLANETSPTALVPAAQVDVSRFAGDTIEQIAARRVMRAELTGTERAFCK